MARPPWWPRWPHGDTHVGDGFLGLLLGVAALLDGLFHLSLQLGDVTLHLLLVDEAGVLEGQGGASGVAQGVLCRPSAPPGLGDSPESL